MKPQDVCRLRSFNPSLSDDVHDCCYLSLMKAEVNFYWCLLFDSLLRHLWVFNFCRLERGLINARRDTV